MCERKSLLSHFEVIGFLDLLKQKSHFVGFYSVLCQTSGSAQSSELKVFNDKRRYEINHRSCKVVGLTVFQRDVPMLIVNLKAAQENYVFTDSALYSKTPCRVKVIFIFTISKRCVCP